MHHTDMRYSQHTQNSQEYMKEGKDVRIYLSPHNILCVYIYIYIFIYLFIKIEDFKSLASKIMNRAPSSLFKKLKIKNQKSKKL